MEILKTYKCAKGVFAVNTRKVKRKCGVRGCYNQAYALSQAREFGNSVIICRDCMIQALEAIEHGGHIDRVSKSDVNSLNIDDKIKPSTTSQKLSDSTNDADADPEKPKKTTKRKKV